MLLLAFLLFYILWSFIDDSWDEEIMSASDWARDWSSFSYKLSIGFYWDSYLF